MGMRPSEPEMWAVFDKEGILQIDGQLRPYVYRRKVDASQMAAWGPFTVKRVRIEVIEP